MLQKCIRNYVEEVVAEEQMGFRAGRGTVDQLYCNLAAIREVLWTKER